MKGMIGLQYDFDRVIDRHNTYSVKWDTSFGDRDILPLWVADMDFQVPQPVTEALIATAKHGIFGYSDGKKVYEDAVIHWMRTRHNWEIEREWINYSPGVVPALIWAIRAFTQPGDKVVLQSPVYPPFFRAIESNGCQVVNNQLVYAEGQYRMDLTDLEVKFAYGAKVMLLCSPHNPVGRVWRREELEDLAALCSKYEVTVIADEIHADLVYKRYKHTTFSLVAPELAARTVVCTAPSKTFNLAGLQTSNIIISDAYLRETYRKVAGQNSSFHPNTFGIAALVAAYEHGAEWLDQLLDYLQDNLICLQTFVNKKMPQIQVVNPEGTYLVWLDLRQLGLEPQQLKRFMLGHAKVACNDGYTFGPGGEGFERMNIACPRATLLEALARLATAVEQL